MLFQRVLVLRPQRKSNAAVVVEDFVVFPRTRVGKVQFLGKRHPLIVSKAEPSFLVSADGELAILGVGAGRRHSFSVDEVQFIAKSERGGSGGEGSFLDVVERSLAPVFKESYGDYLVCSNRSLLGNE